MKEIVDGKIRTCAIVIINSKGDILACHGTGKNPNKGYDFPKGCREEGETDLAAARRELLEETGITLKLGENESLIDCGVHPHNREKNIHIFIWKVNDFPDLKTLECTTYFEKDGITYPENDKYLIIPKSERWRFNHVLQNKFEMIDKYNEELN